MSPKKGYLKELEKGIRICEIRVAVGCPNIGNSHYRTGKCIFEIMRFIVSTSSKKGYLKELEQGIPIWEIRVAVGYPNIGNSHHREEK